MDKKDISKQFADILQKDVVDFVNNNKLLKGSELKSAQKISLEEYFDKIKLIFDDELSNSYFFNVVSYDYGSVVCLFTSNKSLGFKIFEDYKTEGKAFNQYSEEDWVEVLKGVGISVVEGTAYGFKILQLNRLLGMNVPVAGALVSVAYGVSTLLIKMKNEEISFDDFLIEAEIVCIDAAIIAGGAALGQLAIPVPGLGVFLGAIAGSILVWFIEKFFGEQERELLDKINKTVEELISTLEQELYSFVRRVQKEMKKDNFLEKLFEQDPKIQFLLTAGKNENNTISQKETRQTVLS